MLIKTGDVIVFPSNGAWRDVFINLVSKKTHVAFVISEREIIEANINGVVINKLKKFKNVTVLRLKKVTAQQVKFGVLWAKQREKQRYSVLSAVIAGVMRIFKHTRLGEWFPKQWDCSEFVIQIIRQGMDIDILNGINAEDILPDDLLNSSEFTKV